ncbi:MAG: hypothetical protein M1812_003169 [Candelaria pacifica]|nr:MAG: hypothetical protein M1812_003169 [Candelaria pacifica]
MAQAGQEPEISSLERQGESEAVAGIGAHGSTPAENRDKDNNDVLPDKSPSSNDVAPEAKRSTAQIVVIMSALCLSVFLAALDQTIITTALPTISEHFHSSAGYTWVGSAYLLANAATVPTWGKFSDIWGRKPVLLAAAAIFFIGSLISAVSVSIVMLIAGRAVQGVGGGGLIILVNICISDLFSMRNRATYFGLVGMVWALASAVGPVLGGVFTQLVSWRWCFYINLPCTGLGMIVIFFFLDLTTPKTPLAAGLKAIDWLGSITIIGATLMFLLGLEFGGVTFPWDSPKVICLIIFGLVIGVLFFLNEWKLARHPVMPLRLFKRSSNIAALSVCFSHGMVFIAGSYYLPLYFQAVRGASPLLSGVYLLPFALTLSLTSGATGVFIKKTGRYLEPIWFGMAVMTLGFGLLINLDVTSSWAKIILFQIVAGLGVGPNFQSPLIALQTLVAPKDIATATATFGFARNLATSISVVIGGVVFQNGMETRSGGLRASLGPSTAAQLSGGSAGANVMVVQSLAPAQREVARMAFAGSLKTMWILYVCLAAAGLVASAFIGKQVLSKEHQETKTGLDSEQFKKKEAKVSGVDKERVVKEEV